MKRKQKVIPQSKQEVTSEILNSVSQMEIPGMSLMSILRFGGATLLKEAVKAEVTEHLQRGFYRHLKDGEDFKGHRNGYRKTTFDTPIGQFEYDRQMLAYAPDFKSQFHKKYMRRPEEFAAQITDMYVNGISTRKVKDSLRAVAGEKVRLSKSTVSRVTKKIRDEFASWKKRDLSELKVAYLFLDAIRIGMRIGGTTKDSVMLAYAILYDGTCELLSIDLGQSESDKAWGKFVEDLKIRGLKDPLLACSDGNQGVINSIDTHFPTAYRQRCLKHRTENILDAVPAEGQAHVAAKLHQVFYGATSLEQAKLFIKDFKKEFHRKYPTAVERLETDLNQCLTFYLFPASHWKRIRTSNKLERLNKEIRRRLDVIGRHPDETGCLALVYGVTKKYAEKQKTFKANDLVQMLWKKLREEKIAMVEQLELDLYAA
jgi:transposase-like protein